MMKIGFVGVGSVVFGDNVLTDLITHPSLKQEMTICLEDIDPIRLDLMYRYMLHYKELYPEKLEGLSIFKLVQLPEMYVFVTDKFVKRVRKAELTGFEFRESPRSLSDAISL